MARLLLHVAVLLALFGAAALLQRLSPAGPPVPDAVPERAIEVLGSDVYFVRARLLERELSARDRGCRFIPAIRNGVAQGLRLFIRSDSLASDLGFRRGDVVREVNEIPVASPDAALRAYEALRRETELRVVVDRDNSLKTLRYFVDRR